MLKLLLWLGAAYVGLVAIMYLAQTWMLFPAQLAGGGPALPQTAERLETHAPDGTRLAGVYIPAAAEARGRPVLLLGFGGNAWNADALALLLHLAIPDTDVVVFHYRGYGPSAGRPSARALRADAVAVYDHVMDTRAPTRVAAVGLSIGAGAAAHLARHRPVAGLVLVTPFDSLEALARTHYPWAPVGLLLRHRMPVASDVAAADVPVAIIAAERDTIVPPGRTDALRATVPRLVYDRTIAGAGHNDLYDHPDFVNALREALAQVLAPR